MLRLGVSQVFPLLRRANVARLELFSVTYRAFICLDSRVKGALSCDPDYWSYGVSDWL